MLRIGRPVLRLRFLAPRSCSTASEAARPALSSSVSALPAAAPDSASAVRPSDVQAWLAANPTTSDAVPAAGASVVTPNDVQAFLANSPAPGLAGGTEPAGASPVPGPIEVDATTGAITAPGSALTTVPIPMGPELPAAAAGTSVDPLHVPGFFFGTSGVFAMPMRGVEGLLTGVHDLTGAPWWASIVLATVGVRLAVFPLTVMQQRSMARMQAVKPQMDELTAKMKAASSRGEKGLQDTQRYQKLLHELMQKHNVSPMRTMASAAVQIPLWMTFFFTLRGILARPNDGLGFDTGGTLWFPDLTAHDPYFVLPITCGATFYMMSSIDPAGGAAADGTSTQMRTGMKVVAVAMVPVTAWFESGVFVYWTASNLMTLSQTALLRIPAARAAIGMPPLPLLPAATAAARPAEPVIPKLTYATAPKRAGSVAPAAAASPLATELVIESGVQLPAGAGGKAGKGRGPDRGRKKGRR